MIVLRKIDARVVEKIVQPGQTEEFFSLSLDDIDSFDWNVKLLSSNLKGIKKISSLYNEDLIESTTYATLGRMFDADIDIYVSVDDRCMFTLTNNETSVIKCSVKLKTF